jgi:hypothetical protein
MNAIYNRKLLIINYLRQALFHRKIAAPLAANHAPPSVFFSLLLHRTARRKMYYRDVARHSEKPVQSAHLSRNTFVFEIALMLGH